MTNALDGMEKEVTVAQAAAYARRHLPHCCERTVRLWIYQEKISARKITARMYLVDAKSLISHLDSWKNKLHPAKRQAK